MDQPSVVQAAITMLLISSLAATINFATVCAILFNSALRKGRNVFTFNLALADCISSVALFITKLHDHPRVHFGPAYLSWDVPVMTAGLLISILSTLAIAFERLILLRFDALGSRQIVTAKRSMAVCVIVWTLVPSAYLIIHGFDMRASRMLSFAVLPCVILTCLVTTTFCYILIYKKIAKISDTIGLNDAALQRRAKKSKKVLVTFAMVVATTLACWVIMCCLLLEDFFGPRMEGVFWYIILMEVGNTLVCVNGVLNPVITWLRLTVFRDQLNSCFGRLICRAGNESHNSSPVQLDVTDITKKRISISTTNISMQDVNND